ncbi:MAG: GNAT family N-acetyltransferase [Sandaracinaceae bacterium]|nr:GNAT family N-acetyltransferase [Sandaracinaceae bacterium]
MASRESGLDRDPYDARCHHLLVLDTATGEAVGTYRLMTRETAHGESFYSTRVLPGRAPEPHRERRRRSGRPAAATDRTQRARHPHALSRAWRGTRVEQQALASSAALLGAHARARRDVRAAGSAAGRGATG